MAFPRHFQRNDVLLRVRKYFLHLKKSKSSKTLQITSGNSKNKVNLNFDDPDIAFHGKTTLELIRSYFVYQLLGIKPLVTHNLALAKFGRKILGGKIFTLIMRATFYGHFVAGADVKEVRPVLRRMHSFGVRSILDYSVEEDMPHEQAEVLEKKALEDPKTSLPQYKVDERHLDRREGVVSARTYIYQSEAACERNMEYFIKSIECTSQSTHQTGMSAIKLTALCRPKLLLQISEVITKSRLYVEEMATGKKQATPIIQQHLSKEKLASKVHEAVHNTTEDKIAERFVESVTLDEEGLIHLFPWSGILNEECDFNETFQVPDLKTGKMVRFMTHLTSDEVEQFKNMIRRLNTVIRVGEELKVPIMIDAEQTYFQPAISRITVEMMRKYNKTQGIVYNTYQNYLLSSYSEILSDLEQARRQNFYFRCKLVRGAYMEQERQRAQELNYPDPIQPTVEATSENYHKVLIECLRLIKQLKDQGVQEKKIAILVASHNEDTVRLAVQKMQEIGIDPADETVMFAQLYGMCDFITYTLGDAGYTVFKYVPYGPVLEVLPYLSRRAVENKGIMKNVKKEKSMLRTAIAKRIKTFDMRRNPVGPIKPPS